MNGTRRRLLAGMAASTAVPAAWAQNPQGGRAGGRASAGPARVAQILDTSADQQELSRDYSTGVRLAWAQRKAELGRSGAPGRDIQLVNFQTDGSGASLAETLATIRDDASICALLGCAGDRLAVRTASQVRRMGLGLANVGPWMADSRHDSDDQVFCLFASREQQMRHALKSLGGMGVTELGVIYAGVQDRDAYDTQLLELALALKLRTTRYAPQAGEDPAAFAQRLPSTAPAVMLFLGGTIELAQFAQGLGQRGLQRYVVGLSDVDVPTLLQVGVGKSVPLILTQVVPNPQTSPLASVRTYRSLLKQLFDESPSPISLAGYLAGSYAAQVLRRIEGPLVRSTVLAEFQKRPDIDLGGFAIAFHDRPRGSPFVTQTMLTADGRLLG